MVTHAAFVILENLMSILEHTCSSIRLFRKTLIKNKNASDKWYTEKKHWNKYCFKGMNIRNRVNAVKYIFSAYSDLPNQSVAIAINILQK
jgi:hypothetical protein